MHFKVKAIGGYKYLYLIENKWIDGRVKQVRQICVGRPEKVYRLLTGEGELKVKSYDFGKAAALLHASEKMGLISAIERNVPKKHLEGLTIGEYVLLLIIGRSNGSLSRSQIAGWFRRSGLQFIWEPHYSLSSQNCLNQMKRLDDLAIERIEEDIARNLISQGLLPTRLIFDTTNEFTYINDGESLPRKGASKAKRYDKNLVGLGLAVNDANLPFLSEVYPGNEHDSKIFVQIFDGICERLEKLKVRIEDITLVFDKGINSQRNIDSVLERMHLIGSLTRAQVKSLFRVPQDQYHDLYVNGKGHKITGFRGERSVFGQSFTVVVSYNSSTHRLQQRTYERQKARILAGIEDLKRRCARKGRGRKPSVKGVMNAIVDLIPRQIRGVFDYSVSETDEGVEISFGVKKKAEDELYRSFGKVAIFTDLHEWSDEEIVRAYNSKWQIEEDFKWLNDKVIMPLKPFWVRLDLTLRAHVFLCVMGLLLYRYLIWEIGDESLTLPRLAAILDRIRLAVVVRNGERPRVVVEEMGAEEVRIFNSLNLAGYIPR